MCAASQGWRALYLAKASIGSGFAGGVGGAMAAMGGVRIAAGGVNPAPSTLHPAP